MEKWRDLPEKRRTNKNKKKQRLKRRSVFGGPYKSETSGSAVTVWITTDRPSVWAVRGYHGIEPKTNRHVYGEKK